jgi:hypothetical protein
VLTVDVPLHRLNQPDTLHILLNYEQFFYAMEKHVEGETKTYVERACQVWAAYAPLTSLSAQAKVNITADEWRELAHKFGQVPLHCLVFVWSLVSECCLPAVCAQAFIYTYSAKEVTTYMHIFVSHYGEYLQEYGSIEKFSNYALESKHSLLKWILRDCTLGFSRGEAEVVHQELSALIRLEKHDKKDRQNENENENENKNKNENENKNKNKNKKKRKRNESGSENSTPLTAPTRKPLKDRSWSSSSHAIHPENEPYHVSSMKT